MGVLASGSISTHLCQYSVLRCSRSSFFIAVYWTVYWSVDKYIYIFSSVPYIALFGGYESAHVTSVSTFNVQNISKRAPSEKITQAMQFHIWSRLLWVSCLERKEEGQPERRRRTVIEISQRGDHQSFLFQQYVSRWFMEKIHFKRSTLNPIDFSWMETSNQPLGPIEINLPLFFLWWKNNFHQKFISSRKVLFGIQFRRRRSLS